MYIISAIHPSPFIQVLYFKLNQSFDISQDSLFLVISESKMVLQAQDNVRFSLVKDQNRIRIILTILNNIII